MQAPFDSCKDYFKFVWARDFYHLEQQKVIHYSPSRLEKAGRALLAPAFTPIDQLLRNIKNPLVITALTIMAIAIVTIAFYPATVITAVGTVLPFIFNIQPWMLKLTLFLAVELNILAIGMRTLGRLNNASLMQAWTRREIIPIMIGTQIRSSQ